MYWLVLPLFIMITGTALAQTSQSIGKVVIAINSVIAMTPDGKTRPLKRGTEIFEGERLVTTSNSRLQIKMTDGSMVSLDPETDFKLTRFNYEPEAPQNGSAVFELIKGGLRTFSGEVGKFNREDYKLSVSVATIGIRGTNYAVQVCDQECGIENDTTTGTSGTVIDGAISVETSTNSTLVDQAKFFFADDVSGGITITDFPPLGFKTSSASAGASTTEERASIQNELEDRGVIIPKIATTTEYSNSLDISLEQAQKLVEDGFVESDIGIIVRPDAVAVAGGGGGGMGNIVIILP